MLERYFAFQPVRPISLPDWADANRRLPAANSALPGPWKTERVEVARGPMHAVTEPGVHTISICCATQTMKSELLLNTVAYFVHQAPGPILLCQPKQDAARSFSRERLSKMIRETPVLAARFDLRETTDSIDYKEFPGGFIAIEGAGSPTNLAMRAVKVVLLDEIDKYEATKEGDPVTLAEERAATFGPRALRVRACSPTHTETSRIWQSYQASDMRKPFVACPHCDHWQTLGFFSHVNWSKSESGEHFPATAAIWCESCGVEWTEDQRRRAITTKGGIRWHQTRKFTCCDEEQDPLVCRAWEWDEPNQVGRATCKQCGKRGVSNTHAGFQASKLYSPFTTVVALAERWLESKQHPDTRVTFFNTQLGLPSESDSVNLSSIEVADLMARRENYADGTVPHGVVCLTAGIDVQSGSDVTEGRLEVHVMGFGVGDEAWSVAYRIFPGDVAKRDVWQQLDLYLASAFPFERGGVMRIAAACIDASDGRVSQTCYEFAKARTGRKIWAIKGAAERGGAWGAIWPPAQSQRRKDGGFRPVVIGVNSAKMTVANCLAIEKPGPAYFHFPLERSAIWFEQLTAEKLVAERKSGFTTRRWSLPRGRANEALDTTVYALAALHGLKARGFNAAKSAAQIEAYINPEQWKRPMPLAPRQRVHSSPYTQGVRR